MSQTANQQRPHTTARPFHLTRRESTRAFTTAGALLAAMLLGGGALFFHAQTAYVTQSATLSDARFNVAAAHILLEEITAGDRDEPASQMTYHMNAAANAMTALRDGGTVDSVRVRPLSGRSAAALADAATHLDDVRAIAETRMHTDHAAAGTDLDRKLDRAYFAFLAEITRAEKDLHAQANTRTHWSLAAGALLLLAAISGCCVAGVRQARRRAAEDPAERDQFAEMTLLAATVDQAAEIIFITDRDARILYVNRTFAQLVGYSQEEVYGQYAEVLRSSQHEAEFYEDLFFSLSAGAPWRGSLFYRCKDGSDLETEAAITPIRGEDGQVTHMVSVSRDVTREKTLQAQMEHMQRLESLGVLAGGIAHDFNNILTSILGSAGLARLHAEGDARMDDYLERIETSTERAADLCRQMLTYSGRGTLQSGPLDLSAAVTELGRLMEATVPRHIQLALNLQPDLPPVSGDRGQLSQVIMNLLINAQEAIGDRTGTIRVTTGCVHAGPDMLAGAAVGADRPPGDYVMLEVSDTGCGMDAETRRRIFDPFFTTKFTGRGLGMSALMGIVRAHQGAVLVSSQPGHGTTFRVLLPVSDLAPIPQTREEEEQAWRGSGTVLVVDDEEPVRRVAQAMLERMGFTTITACDGVEGLQLLEDRLDEVVCVVLDLTMPRMTGAQVLERIRALSPDLPVLLVSGYNAADAGNINTHAAVRFLQKPFGVANLEAELRGLLEGAG